jgi:hypothetical protein
MPKGELTKFDIEVLRQISKYCSCTTFEQMDSKLKAQCAREDFPIPTDQTPKERRKYLKSWRLSTVKLFRLGLIVVSSQHRVPSAEGWKLLESA